jgi:hypothetical protein
MFATRPIKLYSFDEKMKTAIIVVAVVVGAGMAILMAVRQSKGVVVSLAPGATFPWYKGTTYMATESATIILPGAILRDGTKIGDIIQANDDDMEIGFTPKEGGSGFETIILKFRKGQSVTLGRSSDAILVDEAGKPKTFRKRGK